MAEIKQDLLSLQYSENFQIEGLQEANVDLQLPPAAITLATVTGVVTDGTDPIADATVKLFDSAGMPYKHTLTDGTGSFTITGIPADADYAVVENLLSSQGYTVTATVDNADQTVQYANGEYSFAQQEMDATNHAVIVTNTKTAVSPTGIVANVAPYALLVVIAAAGCFVFLRKRDED